MRDPLLPKRPFRVNSVSMREFATSSVLSSVTARSIISLALL